MRFLKPVALIALGVLPVPAAFVGPVSAEETVSAGWSAPAIEKMPDPAHPAAMRLQGVEGAATVIFIVNEKGVAEDITVYMATRRPFGTSLKNAVEQARFTPARFDGEPVPARVRLMANFRIEGAVVSMSSSDHVVSHITRLTDPHERPEYHVAQPRDLDSIPRPVHTIGPGVPPDTPPFHERVEIHVDFILAPDGSVRAPAVIDSTEHEAAPWLAAAAIKAVRQWKYTAPTVGGKAVHAHVRQVVAFEPLENGVP